MSGNTSQISLTTSLSLLLSKIRSSHFMEASLPVSTLLTRSDSLIEVRKCLMKDPCAICYGAIPTSAVAGASHHVGLATPSDRTFQSSSTTPTGFL